MAAGASRARVRRSAARVAPALGELLPRDAGDAGSVVVTPLVACEEAIGNIIARRSSLPDSWLEASVTLASGAPLASALPALSSTAREGSGPWSRGGAFVAASRLGDVDPPGARSRNASGAAGFARWATRSVSPVAGDVAAAGEVTTWMPNTAALTAWKSSAPSGLMGTFRMTVLLMSMDLSARAVRKKDHGFGSRCS